MFHKHSQTYIPFHLGVDSLRVPGSGPAQNFGCGGPQQLGSSRKFDWKLNIFNNRYHQRTHEKRKMHCFATDTLGSLQRSLRALAGFQGPLRVGGGEEAGEWEERGKKEDKVGRRTWKGWTPTMFGMDWRQCPPISFSICSLPLLPPL